ncbi:winged helix DNA-binding domain-containing protein [Kribbella deserti]|uniref:Winged helix DNA-binding domain-containing protein n=1 Tax=Kribbella deserti TaxID=1926257 RepID=A0ABV6QE53_9ACTN
MTERLSLRQLNRALLQRQGLLERSSGSALETIDHLVGMQSQAPLAPYVGLWSRLSSFTPDELVDLMNSREVVRIVLMRGTIHLVKADDALAIRPLVAEVMQRGLAANKPAAAAAAAVPSLLEVAERLLSSTPMNPSQLAAALEAEFPGHDAALLSRAVRDLLPCVQVPPRGLWRKAGQPTLTPTTTWLGRTPPPQTPPRPSSSPSTPSPPAPSPSPSSLTSSSLLAPAPLTIDDLVLRYLTAFGPASVLDAQAWSGLTRLGEVFDRLRPQLRTYLSPEGRELFDLASISLPDEDTPVDVRFIAEFDNLLLSHADRTRIIRDEHRREIITINGIVRGTILVDGFVTAWWKATLTRPTATLHITPLPNTPPLPHPATNTAATTLLNFLAPQTPTHTITFHPQAT